ncbi:MAG: DUF2177 family protein [Burkholderiales bacterium]|nr:DUF2177 family protein [Burkholderiales bacterium]
MTPGRFALAYVAVLVAVAVLDAIWLGVITKELYKREMGSLMADSFRIVPAALFYLLYPLALVYLVLWHAPPSLLEAMLRSAVLGLAAYGAYNLTNMAVVRGWPVQLSLIDWTWGGVVTALAGGAGWWAAWGRGTS